MSGEPRLIGQRFTVDLHRGMQKDLRVDTARYVGAFLGRHLFALTADDGQEYKAWVSIHGLRSPPSPNFWDEQPLYAVQCAPEPVWKISLDSPELMEFARPP